jgi:hypothetical protein
MKGRHQLIFLLALLGCGKPDEKSDKTKWIPETVCIDTFKTAENMLSEIYFRERESLFPKIRGMRDSLMQNKINDSFMQNFRQFTEPYKAENGLKDASDIEEAKLLDSEPASAEARFQVLRADSVLSVIQYFYGRVGHGGNSWTPGSAVVNYDLKSQSFVGQSLPDATGLPFDTISQRVLRFFEKLFPGEYVSAGIEKFKESPGKLKFGIRSDSAFLLLEAYPAAHSSYATYLIPVGRLKKFKN